MINSDKCNDMIKWRASWARIATQNCFGQEARSASLHQYDDDDNNNDNNNDDGDDGGGGDGDNDAARTAAPGAGRTILLNSVPYTEQ